MTTTRLKRQLRDHATRLATAASRSMVEKATRSLARRVAAVVDETFRLDRPARTLSIDDRVLLPALAALGRDAVSQEDHAVDGAAARLLASAGLRVTATISRAEGWTTFAFDRDGALERAAPALGRAVAAALGPRLLEVLEPEAPAPDGGPQSG